jgi:hypothetical protein
LNDLLLNFKLTFGVLEQGCASMGLEKLRMLMNMARLVVHIIVEVFIYTMNLVLTLFRLILVAGNAAANASATKELLYWFNKIILIVAESLKEVANLLFKLVFGDGRGRQLQEIIVEICKVVKLVVQIIEEVRCKFLKRFVVAVIRVIRDIVGMLGVNTSSLDDTIADINGWECDLGNFSCDMQRQDDTEVPSGALPSPSRCWADYIPSVDDSSSLSCSRSDTCRVEKLTVGGGVGESNGYMVCDSCPLQVADDMMQFGCDVLTKQCTCNRRITSRTSCRTNSECLLPETACTLVTDVLGGVGGGGIPCNYCSHESVCLVANLVTGVGQCSCVLSGDEPTQCDQGWTGTVTSKNPAGLCAVNMDASAMYSTVATVQWGALAVAPCALTSTAGVYCTRVPGHGYLAVGSGVMMAGGNALGRRLLLMQQVKK